MKTSRLRPPRVLLVLALLGWLTQLCLPLAHAASMAQARLGVAAWCGADGLALKAKLAQLAPEVREILRDGLSLGEHASDACSDLCVTPPADEPPAQAAAVALRAAGLEQVPPVALPPPAVAPCISPPARGPPTPT